MGRDMNAFYRKHRGFPRITDPALGIDPVNVEGQARTVGDFAAERIDGLTGLLTLALPYVEAAQEDEAHDAGGKARARKLARKIKAAVEGA